MSTYIPGTLRCKEDDDIPESSDNGLDAGPIIPYDVYESDQESRFDVREQLKRDRIEDEELLFPYQHLIRNNDRATRDLEQAIGKRHRSKQRVDFYGDDTKNISNFDYESSYWNSQYENAVVLVRRMELQKEHARKALLDWESIHLDGNNDTIHEPGHENHEPAYAKSAAEIQNRSAAVGEVDRRFYCDVCGVRIGRASDLRRHLRLSCKGATPTEQNASRFYCPDCNTSFGREQDLRRHQLYSCEFR
jgi:predicted RNA-binding Zn-ribbon protein involved in translation (DUF1610 family)